MATEPTTRAPPKLMQSIPPLLSNRFPPIFLAGKGFVAPEDADPKKKHVKCDGLVVTSLSGFWLLRIKGSQTRADELTSPFGPNEIELLGPKKRELRPKAQSLWFSCGHSDDAISWLIAGRQALYQRGYDPPRIRFVGFQKVLEKRSVLSLVTPETLAQCRCVAFSWRGYAGAHLRGRGPRRQTGEDPLPPIFVGGDRMARVRRCPSSWAAAATAGWRQSVEGPPPAIFVGGGRDRAVAEFGEA